MPSKKKNTPTVEEPSAKETPVVTVPPTPPKKIVWIACRSKANNVPCLGNQAEMISINSFHSGSNGPFEPSLGGKHSQYRCLTCGKRFGIST